MGVLGLALGKTLGELQDLLTEDEWDYWRAFYRLYPFDDLHRHHQPAALLASQGSKNPQSAFDKALAFLTSVPKKAVRKLRPPRVIKGNPP